MCAQSSVCAPSCCTPVTTPSCLVWTESTSGLREEGKFPTRAKGKEELILAYRRFNVISSLFVHRYIISLSGARRRAIPWGTASSTVCVHAADSLNMCLCSVCLYGSVHSNASAWFDLMFAYNFNCVFHFCCSGKQWEKSCNNVGRLGQLLILELIMQKIPPDKTVLLVHVKEIREKIEAREKERERLVYFYSGGRSFLFCESHF